MNKKLLSLLLALVMVFSFIPAFAAEEAPAAADKKAEETAKPEEKAEKKAEEVKETEKAVETPEFVKFLQDNGYVEGDKKGDLMLDKNLTRAQFTALLARLDGKDDVAKAMKTLGTKFTDVTEAHWAKGYISFAAGKDWVKGYPDGTFGPEREVSYAEIATVLVRYMGVDTMGFSYPVDYVAKAFELGLMKDLPAIENYKQAATRENMFHMLYNTLSQKDFGKFNVYKMIVLENNRTSNLGKTEIKAEVLSIVQQANNVDERGIAKIGEQKVFNLVRKNAKGEDEVIGDSENLIGKVINATVDAEGKLVKAVIDKENYKYEVGSLNLVSDKRLKVNGNLYDVRIDERYYNRNDRRYDNDDRMYRTYVTTGNRSANFSYREFWQQYHDKKIAPNFVRATIKDGMVMFIDTFQWNDIAPVQEVKRDGADVYYYDDATNASIRRLSPNGRIIGYTEKDGFYALDKKDIKKDDVIHWMNGFYLVRQDAKIEGKLEKYYVDGDGEWAVIGEDAYFLNSAVDKIAPLRSVYGYDKYFRTTQNRFNLKEMLASDVTALLDVKEGIQLIRSGKEFADKLGLLDNTAYPHFSFLASNAKDAYKTKWTTDTLVKEAQYAGAEKYTLSSIRGDQLGRLDLVYTIGSEDAADVIVRFANRLTIFSKSKPAKFETYKRLVNGKYVDAFLNRWLSVGENRVRWNEDTDVFVVENISDPYSKAYKLTMDDVLDYISKGGKLDAYVLNQKDYYNFLKELDMNGQYRYNTQFEDLAKAIVFTGYKGMAKDINGPFYGEIAAVYSNKVVDIWNGTKVETYTLSDDSIKGNKLGIGDRVLYGDVKGTDAKDVTIIGVITEDYKSYDKYVVQAYDYNRFSVGGDYYVKDAYTREFNSYDPARGYIYAIVYGQKGTATNYGYAEAIWYTKVPPKAAPAPVDPILTYEEKVLVKDYETAVNNFLKAVEELKDKTELSTLKTKVDTAYTAITAHGALTNDATKKLEENKTVVDKKAAFDKCIKDNALGTL